RLRGADFSVSTRNFFERTSHLIGKPMPELRFETFVPGIELGAGLPGSQYKIAHLSSTTRNHRFKKTDFRIRGVEGHIFQAGFVEFGDKDAMLASSFFPVDRAIPLEWCMRFGDEIRDGASELYRSPV